MGQAWGIGAGLRQRGTGAVLGLRGMGGRGRHTCKGIGTQEHRGTGLDLGQQQEVNIACPWRWH